MKKTIFYTEGFLCQIPELWEDCLSITAATVSLPYFLLRDYCCKVIKNHYRVTALSHLHVYPVTAEPSTCYTRSFPKPGTVSCCQVTNCTLLATRSAGPSKHKREKTFKQSFCWRRWLMMHSVFPRNQDFTLVVVHWKVEKHVHVRVMQAFFLTTVPLWVIVWMYDADHCAPQVACARPVLVSIINNDLLLVYSSMTPYLHNTISSSEWVVTRWTSQHICSILITLYKDIFHYYNRMELSSVTVSNVCYKQFCTQAQRWVSHD